MDGDEDWRELYRRARQDAERAHKRKAENRRRQFRNKFGSRPEIHPDGGMPQQFPGGGGWGIPGRNPLMAGGDYDRMPNLPAAPVRLSVCLSVCLSGLIFEPHVPYDLPVVLGSFLIGRRADDSWFRQYTS